MEEGEGSTKPEDILQHSKALDEGKPSENPIIVKNEGVTESEKYLGKLCEKTFLSLWSYPGVFRDQGQTVAGGDGKEICDLLVVFDEHIIIFSDKNCTFQEGTELIVAWKRWFKNAIAKSAKQAWGAKRWLEEHSERVFLDRKCTQKIPIPIPNISTAKFHLVVVAHGISNHVRKHYKGSGSLIIDTNIQGLEGGDKPFWVGELDSKRHFIHIFDECSLAILMDCRNTITDFVDYLEKRERLLRGRVKILAAGEEELLSVYLTNLDKNGKHDYLFPIKDETNLVILSEGGWSQFQKDPVRTEQLKHDAISTLWDDLIEKFSFFSMKQKLYKSSPGGISDTEKTLRFMAREPRHQRRVLSEQIMEMLETTSKHERRIRVVIPEVKSNPYYVFLVFPPFGAFPVESDSEYRNIRHDYLILCCRVVKLKNPQALDIVGIATECGLDTKIRSEDACYLDARHWSTELEMETKALQSEFEVLVTPTFFRKAVYEYPPVNSGKIKIGRNDPCPCGSGNKYKKCCLNKR